MRLPCCNAFVQEVWEWACPERVWHMPLVQDMPTHGLPCILQTNPVSFFRACQCMLYHARCCVCLGQLNGAERIPACCTDVTHMQCCHTHAMLSHTCNADTHSQRCTTLAMLSVPCSAADKTLFCYAQLLITSLDPQCHELLESSEIIHASV